MNVAFRAASEADAPSLLPMMGALWEHEGIPFHDATILPPLLDLLADPTLGGVWLALVDGATAGYAMGTWGFSTEQGGRFLLLDELFVLPEFRGKGVGRAALAFVEETAIGEGAGAVRIEVAEENLGARELYRSAGYRDPKRLFLAKRLAARPAARP